MSTLRKAMTRITGLLTVAVLLCLAVPFSVWAYHRIEERQVAARAAAFLRKSDPKLELQVIEIEPFSGARDQWRVAFRVLESEEHYEREAIVDVDREGRCTGHFVSRK